MSVHGIKLVKRPKTSPEGARNSLERVEMLFENHAMLCS